ncbi:MAG: sporulation protein YabP [Erysipelotrichaceae bacterium]|nr:sporulation protein YabP [Erysipelotrichaceae bacterium]
MNNELKEQILTLNNRKRLEITGVKKLESLNKTEFFVDTILGLLLIRGEDLEMQHLDIEKGILWIIGRVSSLSYLDEDTNKKKDEGFFKKLFK